MPFALLALLLGAAPLLTDPARMLERGPVISVEQDASGQFARCTAVVRVDAPIARVWQVVTAFGELATYMPKIKKSEVVHQEPTVIDIKFEIEVPGVNTRYVMRHLLDPATHTIQTQWQSGDLKGSAWTIHLDATPDGKTLLSYGGISKHLSSVLESMDDEQKTISIGVNISSALTAVTAWKKRAEQK